VVLKDKCIGCGICENKCPVKPKAAILVTAQIPGKTSHGGLNYSSENPNGKSKSSKHWNCEVPSQETKE